MYKPETDYGAIIKHANDCLSRMGGTYITFEATPESYFRFALSSSVWAPSNNVMYVSTIRCGRIIAVVGKIEGDKIKSTEVFEMPVEDMSNDYLFQLWCTYIKTIKESLTQNGWESFVESFTEKFDVYYTEVEKQNYLKD